MLSGRSFYPSGFDSRRAKELYFSIIPFNPSNYRRHSTNSPRGLMVRRRSPKPKIGGSRPPRKTVFGVSLGLAAKCA